MSYRPDNWGSLYKEACQREQLKDVSTTINTFEAGADAMLEALKPLLVTVYAQLSGTRVRMGVPLTEETVLDHSLNTIKKILGL